MDYRAQITNHYQHVAPFSGVVLSNTLGQSFFLKMCK